MMNTVEEYINRYEGEQKEWLVLFTAYMQKNFPHIEGKISYQIPTYKFNDCYIAFSAAKNHFSFHTIDFEVIEELKGLLPKASFGKGCAKVKYTDKEAIPVLYDYCHQIVNKHKNEK